MKSGETAGHGDGRPYAQTARQAKRAGPKLEAGPEASAERSEGTMEARRGETPQAARCEARQRDRPCFLAGDAHAVVEMQRGSSVVDKQPLRHWYCRSGAAGSAASRSAKHRAAPQARRSRQQAQQKKRCAAPAGTTHRRQRGAISSPPAPSSTATARSRPAQRTRKPARPRSAR